MPRRPRPKQPLPVIRYLKQLRSIQRISRTDLARRLGCCEGSLYAWENGETHPRLDMLVAWAQALGYRVYVESAR